MDIIEVALKYIGYPAVAWTSPDKGNTPEGFDCSGFIQFIIKEAGLQLPEHPGKHRLIRHTEEFFDLYGILIHDEMRKPSDLVFFSKNLVRPTHIGLYLGDNKMIHSPGRDNTQIEVCSVDDIFKNVEYNQQKGPQLYVRNPIGYKRLAEYDEGKRYHKVL